MTTRLRAVLSQWSGLIGALVLVVLALVAVVGPLLAPHSSAAIMGAPGQPPGGGFVLGTDYLGRDVLSRLLDGGRPVILMGLGATIVAYAIALWIGITAAYFGGAIDNLLMRAIDVLIAFPALLLILVLIGAFQNHIWVLELGVVIALVPGVTRVARAAALSVSQQPYVDVARARGDSYLTILRRDVLVNILPTVLADFGIRFSWAIVLIASLNFLGLGLTPPAADWGLMITENRQILVLNATSVVAPAIALALLTIGVNLVSDAYLRVISGESRSGAGLGWLAPRSAERRAVVSASAPIVPSPEGV